MEMSAFSHGVDRAQDLLHMPVRSFEEHPLSSLADRSVSRNDDVRWDRRGRTPLAASPCDGPSGVARCRPCAGRVRLREGERPLRWRPARSRLRRWARGASPDRRVSCILRATRRGLSDRELFLPKAWTEHEALRLASGVRSDVAFVTRSEMARRMLERSLNAGVPHRFVAGGVTFGTDAGLRLWLEERRA